MKLAYRLMSYADCMDAAPREGADVDEPEGSRVILVSDTLWRQVATLMREAAGELEKP